MIRRAVIGIGNPDRGDDGAGLAVVRLLRGALPAEVALIELAGDTASLVSILSNLDEVIVVDAMRGKRPGEVRRFDAAAAPLPVRAWASTHAMGLSEAIELSRAIGTLPPIAIVYGIAGSAFGLGNGLSEQAERAVRRVAELVAQQIEVSLSPS